VGKVLVVNSCEVYKEIITKDNRKILIRRRCSDKDLKKYKLAQGFGFFINPSQGIEPLVKAASRGDYVAIADYKGEEVVGFLIAYKWGAEGYGRSHMLLDYLYDIVTEVSRKWRKMGIGKTLLEAAITDPFFEDKVLLIRGNPNYWDCYGSECYYYASFIMEIPQMHFGFKKLPVKMPGDMFTLVRIGKKSNVKLEEIVKVIEEIAQSVEGEFYVF
jgi:GNAT superfamily N-acetyltransferase